MRLGLAIGAGVLALLCLGGVGVFISLYDEATEIKRTAPDAVVDSFLRAYLVNRDQQEEALYTCKAGADFAALAALREELVMREANFDVKVVVSWSSLAVIETDSRTGSVTTDLTIAGTSQGETQSRRTEPWRFGVVDDDGWRVCTATKDV